MKPSMRTAMIRPALIVIGILSAAPVLGAPSQLSGSAIVLGTDRAGYPVAKAQVLVDPSRSLTIEQVRELERTNAAEWRETDRMNFGYSRSRFWM